MIHPNLTLFGGIWIVSAITFATFALTRLRQPRSVLLRMGMWGSLLIWCVSIVGLIWLATTGDSLVPFEPIEGVTPERVEMPEQRP